LRKTTIAVAALATLSCARTEIPGSHNAVEIVGNDYAFTAPERLPAGRTTFRFANNGKVPHELNISRLKKGVSIDEILDSVRADKSVKNLIEGPVGVLFAAPARKSTAGLTVNLSPGEQYAVICIFRDSAGAKAHYDMGMYKTISVGKAQGAAPLPQLTTDTIIATEYAYQYPATVKPGLHTFVMQNAGKQRHELTIVMLNKGVTMQQLQAAEKAGEKVDSLFDGNFGLLHGRGGQTPLGELTIPMQPGREYVIGCFFRDDEKSPEHYALGMFGLIKVENIPYDSTYEKSQVMIDSLLKGRTTVAKGKT
jgi:hypothetical protein